MKWQSTPVLLPGKSHGQMSLISYNPWGHKESDTTERLHFTSFKFRESDTSSFVLYSQDCFGSSRSFLAPCCFRIFFVVVVLFMWKHNFGIFIGNVIEPIDCLDLYGHFDSINSYNPWAENIFPLMCVIFNCFHQCHIFQLQVFLSPPWLNRFASVLFFIM